MLQWHSEHQPPESPRERNQIAFCITSFWVSWLFHPYTATAGEIYPKPQLKALVLLSHLIPTIPPIS